MIKKLHFMMKVITLHTVGSSITGLPYNI